MVVLCGHARIIWHTEGHVLWLQPVLVIVFGFWLLVFFVVVVSLS